MGTIFNGFRGQGISGTPSQSGPSASGVGPDASYGYYNDPNKYGWGNFGANAQGTSDFYSDMARWQQQQQAPQLQRTGIDWSGMGSGMQPMAVGPYPGGGPGMPPPSPPMPPGNPSSGPTPIESPGTFTPITTPIPSPVSGPPISGPQFTPITTPIASPGQFVPDGGESTGSTSSALGAQPPPINGVGIGGGPGSLGSAASGGVAGTGFLARPGVGSMGTGQGSFTNALPAAGGGGVLPQVTPRGAQPLPTTQGLAPPPQQGAAPSSGGQFSNPLFQQGQQARGVEAGVQGQLMSPDMYQNPGQQMAAQSRDAQAQTMGATGSADWYATPNQGVQQQGRAQQQGILNATTAPGLYQTPDYGAQQQSRATQIGTMGATGSPSLYRTPDYGMQQQSRGQQESYIAGLQRDMAGGQPSLAQLQLKQGTDSNIAAAQALAASAGPQNAALAQRQAMQTAAAQNQSLSGQSAMLRAQEYAQARGELGGATANLRGQDLSNLGMSYQNTTNQAQLQAQQAQALRSQDISNLGMTYQNTTNQSQLAAQQAQAMRGQDIQNLGMDYQNRSQQAALAAQQAASMRGADLQNLGMNYQNTTNQAQMATQNAQAMRAQDLQATGMSYSNALAQAQLEAQQNAQQAQLQAGQNSLNANMTGQYYGMANATMSNDLASRMHYADLMASKYANDKGLAQQASQFNQQQNNLMTGSYIGAGATALSMLSDERMKTDIGPAKHGDVSEFLSKLNESTFRYKNEKFGTGEHVGVMAQDVERSRIGKLIVVETPDGKMLDMRKALGALLAAGAVHEKRLKSLEASR